MRMKPLIGYVEKEEGLTIPKKVQKGELLASNDFVSSLNIRKIKRGPFCIIEKPSKKRYIRYTFYPLFVIFGLR